MDIRALHERMGQVNHQPVHVRSFTNKRFTVNFRVPLQELRRIVPEAIELDEVRDSGLGILSMCACDFWVSRLGWLPIPPVRNNDMLCRVSTKIRKRDREYRAYYTLRSDSSSRFLGFRAAILPLPQARVPLRARGRWRAVRAALPCDRPVVRRRVADGHGVGYQADAE
jgi:hypothetical protein